jgi:hypothetical protein
MGRKDRRHQAHQAIHPSRKPVQADRKVLIILGVVTLALVLGTYFARYNGVF